ncbi:MAG: UDP-N-acetylmuramoyl-tripeptide--D-alanyl-D-alanine ligase [Firmicutes bacterium]|nr:UDP-N-acetylmuramoyl-tripeptide--D-alanyl-D-alanine ligase [Bacillota bacterium]
MKVISIQAAAQAAGGKIIRSCGETGIRGVRHDSRQCGTGDMFVCIKGPNRDGHSFIPQVIEQGCRNLLISDADALTDDMQVNAILVEDTVAAMGQLAKYYLDLLDPIRIAVTGSVGKTSTRDMIYYVLSEHFNCGRNLKNYNNDIGLPISIFELDEGCEAVVLEMGMNHFGEIDHLAQIVQPDIGVITNIGVSHMENLGSREGIFRAKMEVTKHLRAGARGGTMVFVYDDEFLNRDNTSGDYESIFVGTDGRSDYILSQIEDRGVDGVSFRLEHNEDSRILQIPVPGRHNAFNGAVAAAVGMQLGMTEDEIARGLSKVRLTGSRLRVLRGNGITVVDDTYNASPDSMKGALKVLQQSSCSGRRTAILGEMYELGDTSDKLHYGVGVFARSCGIDQLIAVGPMAKFIAEGCDGGETKTAYFPTKEAFLKKKNEYVSPGDLILVKASRGMKMEAIVEELTDERR